MLIISVFKSTKEEIKRAEIEAIGVKKRMDNSFLEIKLKGNKIRRVNHIKPISEELKDYITANFNDNNNS